MSFTRTAALAGIVFITLIVLNVILLGDQPLASEDVSEVKKYYSDDEGLHKTAGVLGMLVLPFFAVFFAGLLRTIRASDQERNEGWAVVALFGAIVLGATAGVGDILGATLNFRGGEGLDADTMRALYDAQVIAYAATGVGVATLTAAVSIPGLRHGLRPAWHGWLGLLVAVLGLLALISVVNTSDGGSVFGLISLIGFLVWVLATSGRMLRED